MEKEHYCFEMSRGFCHITKDEVLLSKESNLKQVTASDTFFRQYGMKIYRLTIIPFLIYIGYDDYMDGDTFGVCLTIFLVALLLATTIVSFKYSLKQKIERNTISHLKYQEGIFGVRLPGFVIHFQDRGKRKMCLIPMPIKIAGGQTKINNAIEILREAGLYDKASDNSEIIDAIYSE